MVYTITFSEFLKTATPAALKAQILETVLDQCLSHATFPDVICVTGFVENEDTHIQMPVEPSEMRVCHVCSMIGKLQGKTVSEALDAFLVVADGFEKRGALKVARAMGINIRKEQVNR